jgi:hypothetical protein
MPLALKHRRYGPLDPRREVLVGFERHRITCLLGVPSGPACHRLYIEGELGRNRVRGDIG